MDVEVLELTDTKAKIVIDGVNHAFVNALRRTLIADVPKLAIEEVTIYDNTSALFDEIMSHRLGLLPVPTDLDAFVPRELCTCEGEGCPSCTVLFTLSKEGPGTVYSGDLTPADPAYSIADPEIPIVRLVDGQRVMLEASAILGTGSMHAKWNPVSGVGYREYPKVEIADEPKLLPGTVSDLRDMAPEGSVEFEDGRIRVVDLEKAYDFLRTAKDIHDLDSVTLGFDPNKFIFKFDTDGSLTAEEALRAAVNLLMDKLREVENEVPNLKKQVEA